MSTLWTPGGERPIPREPAPSAPPPPTDPENPMDDAEMAARLEELRDQLARTPVAGIIAQLAYQLFEVAALHLSTQPPDLAEAQLAIDGMAALVEGMAGRLGEHDSQLREGLSQLRMAFVQIKSAGTAEPPPSAPGDPAPPQS